MEKSLSQGSLGLGRSHQPAGRVHASELRDSSFNPGSGSGRDALWQGGGGEAIEKRVSGIQDGSRRSPKPLLTVVIPDSDVGAEKKPMGRRGRKTKLADGRSAGGRSPYSTQSSPGGYGDRYEVIIPFMSPSLKPGAISPNTGLQFKRVVRKVSCAPPRRVGPIAATQASSKAVDSPLPVDHTTKSRSNLGARPPHPGSNSYSPTSSFQSKGPRLQYMHELERDSNPNNFVPLNESVSPTSPSRLLDGLHDSLDVHMDKQRLQGKGSPERQRGTLAPGGRPSGVEAGIKMGL